MTESASSASTTSAWTRGATRFEGRLGPYTYSADGVLYAQGENGCLVRWTPELPAPVAVASLASEGERAITEIVPSPSSARLAVVTCPLRGNGSYSSADAHEVWVVPATGSAATMIFRSTAGPWGIAWSPDGERVAIGGHFDQPRLSIVAADGRLLDDADTAGRWVRVVAWTAEHDVVAWTWRKPADRKTLSSYRPGKWRHLVRPGWPFVTHWWPSHDGRTRVAFSRRAIRVRGAITARWTARDLGSAWEDLRGSAPHWCGPNAILLDEPVLDLRTGVIHPISDDVPGRHPIAISPDGTVAIWRDSSARTWWARVTAP